MIIELNARSKQIFRQIVDAYVATGEPVGSRTIARRLDEQLSPATIRNVMADLEEAGLLYAPHTSAGRVPTDRRLAPLRRRPARGRQRHRGGAARDRGPLRRRRAQHRGVLAMRSSALVGPVALCRPRARAQERAAVQAGRVRPAVSPGRALVVVVGDNGMVENRVIDVPLGMSRLDPDRGRQLSDRAAGRPQLRRGPRQHHRARDRASAAASSTR